MPTFRVTKPNGQSYIVNAPQGASAKDAYDGVMAHYPDTPSGTQLSHTDGDTGDSLTSDIFHAPENLLMGAARGITGLGVGIGQKFSDSPMLKPGGALYDFSQGGSGVANAIGYYAPEALLALAGPEGWAADAAIGAGTGFLQPTESGDLGTSAENAILGAGTAGLAGGAGRAIAKGAAPARAAAAKYGVRLPPTSGGSKFYSGLTEQTHGFNQIIKRGRRASHSDVQQAFRDVMDETGRRLGKDAQHFQRRAMGRLVTQHGSIHPEHVAAALQDEITRTQGNIPQEWAEPLRRLAAVFSKAGTPTQAELNVAPRFHGLRHGAGFGTLGGLGILLHELGIGAHTAGLGAAASMAPLLGYGKTYMGARRALENSPRSRAMIGDLLRALKTPGAAATAQPGEDDGESADTSE
jgi:hypothetical protein